MLVIMRRKGEKIVCTAKEDIPKGATLEIIVTKIDGKQTCLGLEASQLIKIERAEQMEIEA